MPLVALIMGTGAIGSELEDGTAVHLLTKPVARWRIGDREALVGDRRRGRHLPAAGLRGGDDRLRRRRRGARLYVASFIASCVYVALFMALSLVTSRAFIIGLGYVLIWEGLLAGLFPGIRTLSVRQEAISFARSLSDQLSAAVATSSCRWPSGAAAIAAAIIAALAVFVAMRRLARLEIASETS